MKKKINEAKESNKKILIHGKKKSWMTQNIEYKKWIWKKWITNVELWKKNLELWKKNQLQNYWIMKKSWIVKKSLEWSYFQCDLICGLEITLIQI